MEFNKELLLNVIHCELTMILDISYANVTKHDNNHGINIDGINDKIIEINIVIDFFI